MSDETFNSSVVNPVGIDIDGVLSDIAGHLVRFANDRFGCKLSVEDLTSEDVETCSNLTAEQLRQIFSTSRFFQTMPAFKSVGESLKQLSESGWRIVLVTDRFWYAEIQDDTVEWLREHDIPFDSVSFVRKADKATFARKFRIKFFIEDQLSNANRLARVCDRVFLIDRPYNQGSTFRSVTRVSNLAEAILCLASDQAKRGSAPLLVQT